MSIASTDPRCLTGFVGLLLSELLLIRFWSPAAQSSPTRHPATGRAFQLCARVQVLTLMVRTQPSDFILVASALICFVRSFYCRLQLKFDESSLFFFHVRKKILPWLESERHFVCGDTLPRPTLFDGHSFFSLVGESMCGGA